jgi:uncharacterized protein YkwD
MGFLCGLASALNIFPKPRRNLARKGRDKDGFQQDAENIKGDWLKIVDKTAWGETESFRDAIEVLDKVFHDVSRNRSLPGWEARERETMFQATNGLRKKLGKPPVSMEQVAMAERMALGHSDYYHKFPLHCAELVVGE